MLIYFVIYFFILTRYKITSYYVTHYKINIKITTQSFSRQSIIKISSMFSHVYFTIYFLCQKHTHTHPIVLLWFLLAAIWLWSIQSSENGEVVESHKGSGVQCGEIRGRIHKMAAASVNTHAAVTTGTLSSHTPRPSPSPLSTRSRRCSGKPPFASCSWSLHSKHQEALWPGRTAGSPCGGFYWWTCRFLRAGASLVAPAPSPPDRTTLCHM